MITTINTPCGTSEYSEVHSNSSSTSNDKNIRLFSMPVGTKQEPIQDLLPYAGKHDILPEDVEQRIEDAIEDDDEEAWATYLEIASSLRVTDSWLAKS